MLVKPRVWVRLSQIWFPWQSGLHPSQAPRAILPRAMLVGWDSGHGTGSGTSALPHPDAAEISGAQISLATSTFQCLRQKQNLSLDDVSPSLETLEGLDFTKHCPAVPPPGAVTDQHPPRAKTPLHIPANFPGSGGASALHWLNEGFVHLSPKCSYLYTEHVHD